MTLVELWTAIQQFGTGFVLLLGTVLFFRGELVNGGVARQARKDAEDALVKAHGEQIYLMKQRYEEMQSAWRERCSELAEDRDYYRNFALTFARQAEQGIALANDKMPRRS